MKGIIQIKNFKIKLFTTTILIYNLIFPKEAYAFAFNKEEESNWIEVVMVSVLVLTVGKYTYDKLTKENDDLSKWAIDDSSSFALRYLLHPDSLEVFNNLSSEQERISYNDSFWKINDPYSIDKQNELKYEFDERVSFANQNFTTPYLRGWRTDQGRIFILHGKPSEKILMPFQESFFQSPLHSAKFLDLEIWLYEEAGERRNLPQELLAFCGGKKFFLFARLSGNNNYEQVYSSEIGELNHNGLFNK